MDRELYRFKRTASDEVVFSLRNYKGNDYFDIRIFFTGLVGESHATKKGVTIRIQDFPGFMKGVEEVAEAIANGGSK